MSAFKYNSGHLYFWSPALFLVQRYLLTIYTHNSGPFERPAFPLADCH